MSTEEFALDSSGSNRIQLFSGSDGSTRILHNRSIIGSIVDGAELADGHEFMLKDGTIVKVQAINGQLQVAVEGRPLSSISMETVATLEGKVEATRRTTTQEQSGGLSTTYQPQHAFQRILGYITIIGGSLLALFAFFALPYYTFGGFSLSASQLAGLGAVQQIPNENGFYWVEAIFPIIMVLVALWQSLKPREMDTGSALPLGSIMMLTLLTFMAVIILAPSSTTITPGHGSGFWAYVVGMLIVLVGDVAQLIEEW
jgi:hypothetical protein